MTQRLIRRAANQSRVAVADLLEAVFVAELIAPGTRLMLVSPWISDFPIVDNRSGQYLQLDAQWSATRIRFSTVLRSLLSRGVRISIACSSGDRENAFIEQLTMLAQTDGTEDLLRVRRDEVFRRGIAHEKALVADNWAIHGSMNFTYSGVELNGELVTFTDDPEAVSALATELQPLFGDSDD
jgi:phosphatidylserine/phosphatidylglycerophosphate/cardiolipin synthase-like enzyme